MLKQTAHFVNAELKWLIKRPVPTQRWLAVVEADHLPQRKRRLHFKTERTNSHLKVLTPTGRVRAPSAGTCVLRN